MPCQGSTCTQGRAECKSPKLCRAMNAPVSKDLGGGNYHGEQAHLRGPRRVERIGLRVLFWLVSLLAAGWMGYQFWAALAAR